MSQHETYPAVVPEKARLEPWLKQMVCIPVKNQRGLLLGILTRHAIYSCVLSVPPAVIVDLSVATG